MGSRLLTEILLIFLLIVAGGFFAAAEIAIISARRGRLKQQAEAGDSASKIALELASNPQRFLPAVQVGITVIGTFAGVYGGASLVDFLAAWGAEQESIKIKPEHLRAYATAIVGASIAFLSIVAGELVPKQLALSFADQLARYVAKPMWWFQWLFAPVVWLLRKTTDLILWPFGLHKHGNDNIAIEDIEHMVLQGAEAGVVEHVEAEIARQALRLGDQRVKDIMRNRVDIDAIDIATPREEIIGALAMANFTKVPVYEETLDNIIGYIHLKDVVVAQHMKDRVDLKKIMREPLFVPQSLAIDKLLRLFRKHKTDLAIVVDEFGGTQGMITLEDVFAEFVEIDMPTRDTKDQIVKLADGRWSLDGSVTIDN